MNSWLNQAELVLNHGDLQAKYQFMFWVFGLKLMIAAFVFTYAMSNNWLLHYFRTLVSEELI